MKFKTILIAGVLLLTSTEMMAAKKAKESVGNVMYNKAYIDCKIDGKTVVNDYIEYDNIGFDFTKFIPKLVNSGSVPVTCIISGYLELPKDYTKPKIDLIVENQASQVSNTHIGIFLNDTYQSNAKYFNTSIITKGGIKYIKYQIKQINDYGRDDWLYSHAMQVYLSAITTMPVISSMKLAQKRGEEDEIVPLDTSKIFIFEE